MLVSALHAILMITACSCSVVCRRSSPTL